MVKNVRMRLLLVMQLLTGETNSQQGVTMQEIVDFVNEQGFSGERKSIYEDIHALQEFGLPIVYYSQDKTYRFQQ